MAEPHHNPRNPTVGFESRDVNIRAIMWFGVGLAGLIVASLTVVYGIYWHLEAERTPANRSNFPVAEATRRRLREKDPEELLPRQPRLDGIVPVPAGQPAGRILSNFAANLGEIQEKKLTSWQWADADHTVARIPIGEAMSRLLAKPNDLLKAQPGAKPLLAAAEQPNASNSGRGPSTGGQK